MSESETYRLRWRGQQSGPYTIQEINRKLDQHEIGMGHEVKYRDKWITVEELFSALKSASASLDKEARRPVASPVAGPARRPISPAVAEHAIAASASLKEPVHRVAQSENSAAGSALRTVRQRNRIVYAASAILLGFTGLHNFYARHWLTGLFQLFLSLTTFLLGFGIIASWIWALVEAVVVRKDGYGTEMR